MHEPAAGAFEPQTVDGFWNLDFQGAVQSQLRGLEGLEPRTFAQPLAQHEAPVAIENLFALRFAAEEVALLQGMVLIDEPVIGSQQKVAGIGVDRKSTRLNSSN